MLPTWIDLLFGMPLLSVGEHSARSEEIRGRHRACFCELTPTLYGDLRHYGAIRRQNQRLNIAKINQRVRIDCLSHGGFCLSDLYTLWDPTPISLPQSQQVAGMGYVEPTCQQADPEPSSA